MKITENHLLVMIQPNVNNLKHNKITNKITDTRLISFNLDKISDKENYDKLFDILTLGNL